MRNIVGVCLLIAATAVSAFAAAVPPVPEPATIVLLGGGLTAFGLVAWRRNRRK